MKGFQMKHLISLSLIALLAACMGGFVPSTSPVAASAKHGAGLRPCYVHGQRHHGAFNVTLP
jgi:hypothetical protein